MHPRVLASDALSTPVAGYCTRSDAPASLTRVAALVQQIVVPGAVISHVTAAELLGLPLPVELTRAGGAPVHCTAEERRLRRTRRSVVVHSGPAAGSIRLDGLRVAPPLSVVRQIAPLLSHEDLVACLDALAARRHGAALHVPLDRLRREAESLRGPGAAAVRAAAADARENVWSPMETRVRLLVIAQGFPEPVPNHLVREPETDRAFYIDLAYPLHKVAVEYDSEAHRLDERRWRKDLHKNEVLHQQGWSVLRVSVADIREPSDFRRRLAAAVPRSAA